MAWFVGRSVVIIALAFALGIGIGWLWWRRRKVNFGESQAIAELTANHRSRRAEFSATLQTKDDDLQAREDEIARLRTELETRAATTIDLTSGSATWQRTGESQEALVVTLSDAASVPPPVIPSDPSPEILASLATPVEEIPTSLITHLPVLTEGPPVTDLPTIKTRIPRTTAPVPPVTMTEGTTATHIGAGATPAPLPTTGPTAAAAEPPAEPGTEAETDLISEPPGDDLERIEGIGPRIGTALRGAGIHTYRQLADADASTLQTALEQAGLRFAPSLPTWSRQARFLADGDETGFQALAEQLTGGHNISGTK